MMMNRHLMIIIAFTGTSAIIIIVGALLLAFFGKTVPEPLWGLGGAAMGSLGTLLTGHGITSFGVGTRQDDTIQIKTKLDDDI